MVKDRLVADLLPDIRQVLDGQPYISPSVQHCAGGYRWTMSLPLPLPSHTLDNRY